MPTVNIISVVDTLKITNDYPKAGDDSSFAAPQGLKDGSSYIYMVADAPYVYKGEATSELAVKLHSGDVLIWRFTPIDRGQTLSLIVVEFLTIYNDGVDPADYLDPEPPGFHMNSINVYEPPNETGLDDSPTKKTFHDNFFKTSIKKAPEVDTKICYQWKFKLIDQNGFSHGYYQWDPFILVAR